ncbi:MAG: LysR family transcriptional regulator [Parasporobacterium sp.]|nr:LysR family transcriptional regulator [Parasporobacterium sp.]
MNSKMIDCFIAVVEKGSYTKAAEELFMTQSTVSRYIKALEDELDCRLLERTTKRVFLTPEGEKYFAHYKVWREEFRRLKEEIDSKKKIKRKLCLGYFEAWPFPKFYQVISNMIEKNSEKYELEFVCDSYSNLYKGLKDGTFDGILCFDGGAVDNTVTRKEIGKVDKMIVSSKNFSSTKKKMNILDLKDEIFFVPYEENEYVKKCLLKFCSTYGFAPKIREVKGDIHTVYANIQSGRGVGMLDEKIVSMNKDYVNAIHMHDEEIVWFLWKMDNNNLNFLIEELF